MQGPWHPCPVPRCTGFIAELRNSAVFVQHIEFPSIILASQEILPNKLFPAGNQWFIPNVWMSWREFPLVWSCLSWQTDVFTASFFLTKFVSATNAYRSVPPLCCLPGDNKIMNLNMKQSLSETELLPSIAVFLIFPDTVILSSFVALNMNVSCTSHAVFSTGSINPTVWKALGIWSKATVKVDFGSCVFQTAALSSFPKGVWGTEMRPCPGQDKDLSIDVKRAQRQSKHQML